MTIAWRMTELNRVLRQQYHAVVGNPPYITVKDRALNQAYRNRFATCHRQYSLLVPFMERFFELAIYGHEAQSAGYVGMITANSFMKREFGKKLIEEFFPGRPDPRHRYVRSLYPRPWDADGHPVWS